MLLVVLFAPGEEEEDDFFWEFGFCQRNWLTVEVSVLARIRMHHLHIGKRCQDRGKIVN